MSKINVAFFRGFLQNIPTMNNLNINNDTRSVVLYARISKEASEHNVSADSLSLAAQLDLGRRYADYNGHNIIGEFTETFSAKRADNRFELQKAVKLAKKNKAILFVYSLSRLSRSLKDTLNLLEEFKRSGIKLYSHSEKVDLSSTSGELFVNLIQSFNSYERKETARRTKTALAYKRINNKRISGKIPFGYKLSKNQIDLIEIPKQQKIIRKIEELRSRKYSSPKIAEILNAEGEKTAQGKKWIAQSVLRVLKRQRALASTLGSE